MATRTPSLTVRIAAGVTAVVLLGGVLLTLTPQSTDDGTSTTSGPLPTTSTSTTEAEPTTTLADAEFLRIVSGITTLIDTADGQRCGLIPAYAGFGELPTPGNEAQVRLAVEVTAQLLRSSAGSVGEDEQDVAAAISATADALVAEAEAEGYDPDWLNTPPGNQALADPDFSAAVEAYQQRTEELCAPPGEPSPTTPG